MVPDRPGTLLPAAIRKEMPGGDHARLPQHHGWLGVPPVLTFTFKVSSFSHGM